MQSHAGSTDNRRYINRAEELRRVETRPETNINQGLSPAPSFDRRLDTLVDIQLAAKNRLISHLNRLLSIRERFIGPLPPEKDGAGISGSYPGITDGLRATMDEIHTILSQMEVVLADIETV